MYHKTLHKTLTRCGWEVIDEAHGGILVPHYFEYAHPSDTSRTNENVIAVSAESNKNGTPGRIITIFKGEKVIKDYA